MLVVTNKGRGERCDEAEEGEKERKKEEIDDG